MFAKAAACGDWGTYSPAGVPGGTVPPLREAAARPLTQKLISNRTVCQYIFLLSVRPDNLSATPGNE